MLVSCLYASTCSAVIIDEFMALLGNEAEQASMAGTRSNCSLFSLDVVAIFAIVHCVRLLCSLFYFVLTNQTCKLLDSSSRFALTAAAS